MFFLRSKTRLS